MLQNVCVCLCVWIYVGLAACVMCMRLYSVSICVTEIFSYVQYMWRNFIYTANEFICIIWMQIEYDFCCLLIRLICHSSIVNVRRLCFMPYASYNGQYEGFALTRSLLAELTTYIQQHRISLTTEMRTWRMHTHKHTHSHMCIIIEL